MEETALQHHDDDSLGGLRNTKTQSRRPVDAAIRQQRMKSWKPILDPVYVIIGFFALGAVFVGTGNYLEKQNSKLVDIRSVYDAYNATSLQCHINEANANKTCTVEINVGPQDLHPPVLIHYEIKNFYQNHRKYLQSVDLSQLQGKGNSARVQSNCVPLFKLGGISLNPCGLIANTFFNDVIILKSPSSLFLNETGIAWKTDVVDKFKQPLGFRKYQCSSCDDADCSCSSNTGGGPWSCQEPYQFQGKCWLYYYPNEDSTQYLYETYPNIINPVEGVLNEHFIVWMRTATLPRFRKLYGWINQSIPANTVLEFEITANWDVQSFKGQKALLVSTTYAMGGKNDVLGSLIFWIGITFFAVGALFGVKHAWKPRRLGDPKYLKPIKEE